MELYVYKIKEITKVYDGDTITVIIDLGMNISVKEVIRLYSIDTPEIRGEERPEGLISKAFVQDKLQEAVKNNKTIYIRTHKDKSGKYGRLLGEIIIEDEVRTLNEQLVDNGLAEERFY